MSVKQYDSTNKILKLIAGGTLWADCPIGTINAFGGATAPEGWLLCQGQALSRTDYADLFAVIGTNYGAGDGSTTFNLPDMREAAPVGAGTSTRSTIATHDSYMLGEFKDDQFQAHFHRVGNDGEGSSYGALLVNSATSGTSFAGLSSSASPKLAAQSNNISGRAGDTTHGKQLGVNFIIKTKQAPMPADLKAALEAALDNKDMLVWN